MDIAEMAAQLRYHFSEAIPEDDGYYVNLPYSDGTWLIDSHEIVLQAREAFPLARLSGVKTLSFLTYFGSTPENQYSLDLPLDRFIHTLVVTKVAAEIARRNGLSNEEITLVVTAATLHDIAIPAFGDAATSLDPKNLHEELWWWEVLGAKGEAFLDKLGINKAAIGAIISNQGALGQILDIADRITYVMQDAFAIIGPNIGNFKGGLAEMLSLMFHQNPNLGNIYQDVRVDQKTGRVYFENPDRLGLFLLTRALLAQNLYYHPLNQGRDLYWASLIRPFYTPDESQTSTLLTPARLRRMTDSELTRYLTQAHQLKGDWLQQQLKLLKDYPNHYEPFGTLEAAREHEASLQRNPAFKVLGIKEIRGFNPATTYLVKGTDNTLSQFRHFDPEKARELATIAQSTQSFYVYYSLNAEETAPLPRIVTS